MCDRVELAFSEVGQEPAAAVPEQTYGTGVGRCAKAVPDKVVKNSQSENGVDHEFKITTPLSKSKVGST